MKNVLKPLGESVLIPLGLTAAASATETAIQKTFFGQGMTQGMTAVIISNEEMDDIMKIVKSLEKSGLLIKGVSKKKIKQKNKMVDFSDCYQIH